MKDLRGSPSKWLLHNSKGYPDFLFTILSYSLLLLAFVSLIWIAFALLAFIHAGSPQASVLIRIMKTMQTGLVSLAGVVFGLAGSYTVRRYKYDDHYLKKKVAEHNMDSARQINGQIQLVQNQEDV